MTQRGRTQTSLLPSLLVLILAFAGLAQGLALMLHIRTPEGAALLQQADGLPMWALWLAVVLSVSTRYVAMWARVAMVLFSVAGLAFRGVLVWFAWPGINDVLGRSDAGLMIELVVSVVIPAVLTTWAGWDVFRARRDAQSSRRVRSASSPTPPSLPKPAGSPSASNGSVASPDAPVQPFAAPSDSPDSMLTPVGPERAQAAQTASGKDVWFQVSSPWPTAVEDDPDGTLLRPPRRRA